jgi:hypothetical protein
MALTLPRVPLRGYIAITILAALSMSSVIAAPAAQAAATDMPAMDRCEHVATIQSLRVCVLTMTGDEVIDNQGITRSLLAKIDAAQAAVDRGQPEVAESTLAAFIHDVQAQAGKHIAQPHADHLVMHAQLVLQALEASPDTATG